MAATADTSIHWIRREADIIAIAVGLVVLAFGMVVARHGTVPGWEEWLFRRVNDLPGALYPVLWPFQQLGVLIVGAVVAIVAAITRRFRLALAALIVTAAKLVVERLVKAAITRERPGTSIGGRIHLRGDVPVVGESFVSGHAILATGLAVIVMPYLPGRWKFVPPAVAALVLLARVYVGAHNPLDVICGAGLGVAIGSAANLIVGVPSRALTGAPSEPADAG